jgi:hypothetical protein
MSTRLAPALSASITVSILILIGSPVISRAATIEEVARCRAIQVNKARWDCFKALKAPKQNAPKAKKADTPPSQTKGIPKAKKEDDPKKSDDASPAAPRAVQEAAPDDPASTSSIDHLSVAPGQPVCADQDSLAAAFVAAVVLGTSPAQVARYGCQTIPKDAKVEILQRLPSGFEFLRVVKVNVTSPSQADATVGYTFEIRR